MDRLACAVERAGWMLDTSSFRHTVDHGRKCAGGSRIYWWIASSRGDGRVEIQIEPSRGDADWNLCTADRHHLRAERKGDESPGCLRVLLVVEGYDALLPQRLPWWHSTASERTLVHFGIAPHQQLRLFIQNRL